MARFIDLHCHYLPSIDDGVRSVEDGIALLRGLAALGFETVVATPHMRPQMFDNDARGLRRAFEAFELEARKLAKLPARALASEHFFDDVIFERLRDGNGLPYPGGKSVLVELPPRAFPNRLAERLTALKRAGLTPVLAHPERYEPVWKDPGVLEPLLDAGALLLLDTCALVGKYGSASERTALTLLELEAYDAACSDAHKPQDVDTFAQAIRNLEGRVGLAETERLLGGAPRDLLGLA